MITAIIAISENLAIGRNGKLPWHYTADLKFFRETTIGRAIAMGSNTWRSIGRPLPGRLSLVLSRSTDLELPEGVIRIGNMKDALELSKYLVGDLYVIGGASVYAEFADVIDQWLVTFIPETIADADTFMPNDFLDDFEVVHEKHLDGGLVVKTFRRSGVSGV